MAPYFRNFTLFHQARRLFTDSKKNKPLTWFTGTDLLLQASGFSGSPSVSRYSRLSCRLKVSRGRASFFSAASLFDSLTSSSSGVERLSNLSSNTLETKHCLILYCKKTIKQTTASSIRSTTCKLVTSDDALRSINNFSTSFLVENEAKRKSK